MKITIVPPDGKVGVGGDFRTVDLSALDPEIHAIQYDTVRATGKIEFDALAKESVPVRDLAAEAAQELALRVQLEAAEQAEDTALATTIRAALNALGPVMTSALRPRKQIVLDPAGFAQFQPVMDAWTAAAPIPPVPIPPPDLSDIDQLERTLRAICLLHRQDCNALKSEMRGLAVLLVGKGTISAAEAGALLAYDGSGAGDAKTVADLKADFAALYNGLAPPP